MKLKFPKIVFPEIEFPEFDFDDINFEGDCCIVLIEKGTTPSGGTAVTRNVIQAKDKEDMVRTLRAQADRIEKEMKDG